MELLHILQFHLPDLIISAEQYEVIVDTFNSEWLEDEDDCENEFFNYCEANQNEIKLFLEKALLI